MCNRPPGPLWFGGSLCILPHMKNTTENTNVPQVTKNPNLDHGPTASAGLTIREYREMQEEAYWAQQEYLDYINER